MWTGSSSLQLGFTALCLIIVLLPWKTKCFLCAGTNESIMMLTVFLGQVSVFCVLPHKQLLSLEMWAFTLYYWALGQQHSLVKAAHVPRVYATACMCAHWRLLFKRSSFILTHAEEEFIPEAALHQSWWCSKWNTVCLFFKPTTFCLHVCLGLLFCFFSSIFADLLMCSVRYLCNTSYVIHLASFLQKMDHRWSFMSWKFGCNVVHTNTECIYVFLIMNREKLYCYTQSKYLHICSRYVKILCPDILIMSFWTLIRSVSLQFIGSSQ